MKTKLALLALACVALLGAANTSTYVIPGGWAICDVVPSLCAGHDTGDSGNAEWIAVISTDAPSQVVAFRLDILGVDGITRTFLVGRSSETPERTMASIKLGKVPIRSVATTLLQATDTSTQ